MNDSKHNRKRNFKQERTYLSFRRLIFRFLIIISLFLVSIELYNIMRHYFQFHKLFNFEILYFFTTLTIVIFPLFYFVFESSYKKMDPNVRFSFLLSVAIFPLASIILMIMADTMVNTPYFGYFKFFVPKFMSSVVTFNVIKEYILMFYRIRGLKKASR